MVTAVLSIAAATLQSTRAMECLVWQPIMLACADTMQSKAQHSLCRPVLLTTPASASVMTTLQQARRQYNHARALWPKYTTATETNLRTLAEVHNNYGTHDVRDASLELRVLAGTCSNTAAFQQSSNQVRSHCDKAQIVTHAAV